MNGFISCKNNLNVLLPVIIDSATLHSKWLNTLSFLENCGARKIAACEHPTLVKEEMLKHASEEFRHAHSLKKQIERISLCKNLHEDYSLSNILGGMSTFHYLSLLDLQACRFLSKVAVLSKNEIKEMAYLLVTYAIELRADELYPLYEYILRSIKSKVTVKSILLEEKEHLADMKAGIDKLPRGQEYASQICFFESQLCIKWLHAITLSVIPSKGIGIG